MNGFFATLSEPHLEELQYSSGILALVATAVVAIGLVAEYQGSKSDARTNWYPLTGGPPPYWDLERKGDWLIVIGVVFEFAFGWLAFASTSALDTQRQHEIATLHHEAERLKAETALKEEQLEQGAWLLGSIFLPRRVAVSLGPSPNGKGAVPSGHEFATLKQFAGIKALIVAAPDLETIQLAADIAAAVAAAGWDEGLNSPNVTILSMNQGYSLVGVHVSIDAKLSLPLPQSAHAAQTLMSYLRSGYLQDFSRNSSAGIQTDMISVSASDAFRPEWWPRGFAPPTDTVCIFVGRKDFTEAL